jgi:hypothetical protein
MPSQVKVPLLGTHSKGTVIVVGVGGAIVAGILIYHYKEKQQAAATQQTQATSSSGYGYGTSANGYGYGYGYNQYGYGEPEGYYGYGGGGEVYYGYGTTGSPPVATPPAPSAKVKVPDVIGLNYAVAARRVKLAGLKAKKNGPGKIVQTNPQANTTVARGSTVVLFGANK